MRVPKFGFRSRIGAVTAQVRTGELNKLSGDVVSLAQLKAANIIRRDMKRARIMLSCRPQRALQVQGADIRVSKGAKAAIEAAGGQVQA